MEDTSTYAVAEEAAKDPEEDAVVKDIPGSLSRDANETGFEGAIFSSSSILDLSQRGLCHLGEFFKIPNLKHLHLQRNSLSEIPKDFFQLLPNLTWLDLRYNNIRALPSGIGSHRHLKTLLLERNPIKTLPVELVKDSDPWSGVPSPCETSLETPHRPIRGHVTTLKALNLRHCPLEFPPHLIVQKGLVAILTFLRICSVENAFPGDESPQEVSAAKMNLSDLPCPVLAQPEKGTSSENGLNAPSHEAAVMKEKGDFFPPMDRLDLSELRRPSASSENWPSEEEIKRFWKLRQEIVENEKVDALEKKLLAVELPPNLRAALTAKEKRPRKPGPACRKRSTSFRGILPNLPSTYQNTAHTKRLDSSHVSTLRELQGKETILEQRRSSTDNPAVSCYGPPDASQYGPHPQYHRAPSFMVGFGQWGIPEDIFRVVKAKMASKIPFGTDLIDHGEMPVNPFGKVKHSRERAAQKSAEMSASPLAELEEKIRRHTQQIRARNFLGTNPLQDMKMANQDLETAKKLQEELRKLKLEMTLNKEHSFATFLGNLSLHPPASQPQNIFFNTKY